MSDKEVKEKLESLNPLSGGIVFGKEEAWDKLQARMDKKPARKIAFSYRLAAAAVLLLCVSVIGYYFYPEKQIASSQPLNPITTPDTEHTVVSTTAIEPVTIAEQEKETDITHIKKDVPHARFVVREQPITIAPEPAVDTVIPEPITVVNVPKKPAAPPIKKMRVVHINDLGHAEDGAAETVVAYAGPTLDISKMKVVSLYDIQREESAHRREEEVMAIVRINRPHNGFFSLPNSLSRSNPDNRSFAQSPLTIRLNRNN